MRVFVAGGSGVLERRLVPQLVARGHDVTATTTSPNRLATLEQLGAEAVVMDRPRRQVGRRGGVGGPPQVVVHQLTDISPAHASSRWSRAATPSWRQGFRQELT